MNYIHKNVFISRGLQNKQKRYQRGQNRGEGSEARLSMKELRNMEKFLLFVCVLVTTNNHVTKG